MSTSEDSEVREAVASVIKELKALAPPDPNEVLFGYLQAVHRRRRTLLKTVGLKELRRELRGLTNKHGIKGRPSLARMLIELSAREHVKPKMKNKYAQTLDWARRHRVRSKDLKSFVEEEHGINRCSERYRAAAKTA